MPSFSSAGVRIAYDVEGEGPPVLLIHGFASNGRVNWRDTGWLKALPGRRIIMIDNRGHGDSEKLYDQALYHTAEMAEDARRLLDHLGVERAALLGYSMGARIAAILSLRHPGRVDRLVLGGMAAKLMAGVSGAEAIAAGLEADAVPAGGAARAFRLFAAQTKSDLKALAACMRAGRQPISAEDLAKISCPVLVVAGDLDDVAGPLEPILAAIPGARGAALAGRNHMNAVGDKDFKRLAFEFIS